MKIEELFEAPPGVGRGGVLGTGFGNKGRSILNKQVNAAYKLWLTLVPKIAASGTINMRDPTTYATYFGNWMSRNLKIEPSDPIITNTVNSLRSQELNKAVLKNAIRQMIGQYRARAYEPTANEPEPTTAADTTAPTAPTASQPTNQWNATAQPGNTANYGKAIPGGGARNAGPMAPVTATSAQPNTVSATAPQKGPPEGAQMSAGDVYYTVKGGQWRRNDNGEPASAAIAKLLSQQVGA